MAVPQIPALLGRRARRRLDRRAMEFLHHRLLHLGRLECGKALMLPAEPFRPKRADWLQAAAVALALFAVYAATAPRTVALEDDGLFILSSYFLGIEHPPGYPLFIWIGHLFTYLPFGSVAYRVHLASALFGALTGGAAWLCARALIGGRLPAYLAAFALGVSPVFWWQPLPISFNGPLETIQEILFFVGRKGYAGVDHSVSAGWLDRVRFFEFFGGELLRQFAVVGTLLAVAGFVVQWRILGQRVAAFLSVAF